MSAGEDEPEMVVGVKKVVAAVVSGIVVLALVLIGVSFATKHSVVQSGVLWRHQLADGQGVGANFAVVSGEIYEFGTTTGSSDGSGSATSSLQTVKLLDPATGSVRQEWDHPAQRRPYLTYDGDVLFQHRVIAPGSNRATTELSLYSPRNEEVWTATIQHGGDEDVYVTAAAGERVRVAVCGSDSSIPVPGDSAYGLLGDDQISASSCQARTIDAAGALSAPTTVLHPWEQDTVSWTSLPGDVLPQVTRESTDLTRIDLVSPAQSAPVLSLPYTVEHHPDTMVLTRTHFITMGQQGDTCVIRGYKVAPSAKRAPEWSSTIACDKKEPRTLVTTTDTDGTVYAGVGDALGVDIYAVAQAAGEVEKVPDNAYTRRKLVQSFNIRSKISEVTAGDYVVRTDSAGSSEATVTRASSGEEVVHARVRGDVGSFGTGRGNTVGLISTARGDDSDLPRKVRFNPFLRGEDLQLVTVFDTKSGNQLTTSYFTSTVIYLNALGHGKVLVATDDGRLTVVGTG